MLDVSLHRKVVPFEVLIPPLESLSPDDDAGWFSLISEYYLTPRDRIAMISLVACKIHGRKQREMCSLFNTRQPNLSSHIQVVQRKVRNMRAVLSQDDLCAEYLLLKKKFPNKYRDAVSYVFSGNYLPDIRIILNQYISHWMWDILRSTIIGGNPEDPEYPALNKYMRSYWRRFCD